MKKQRNEHSLLGCLVDTLFNTSPAFPPVPDDGASPMTGIETADVGDNLEGMQP